MKIALIDLNEISLAKMDLVLFDFAIKHVCKISRVFALKYGNALLIGVGGTGR